MVMYLVPNGTHKTYCVVLVDGIIGANDSFSSKRTAKSECNYKLAFTQV